MIRPWCIDSRAVKSNSSKALRNSSLVYILGSISGVLSNTKSHHRSMCEGIVSSIATISISLQGLCFPSALEPIAMTVSNL